jgi:hypothetical protein
MDHLTKPLTCIVVLCLMLLGVVPASAEFIIDDFSAPANPAIRVISLLDPDPSLVKTTDAGILGGERDVLLDVAGVPRATTFIGEIGGGTFVFGGASPGTAATIQYDGPDADVVGPPAALVNADGLGGIDLTAYGDRFALSFLGIDGGGAQTTGISITVHSPGGTSSTLVDTIPDSAGPSVYTSLPFASWVLAADPTNVSAVEFRLNWAGVADVDFELDKISIVPEPSAIALCAAGLACLLAYVWRRRK